MKKKGVKMMKVKEKFSSQKLFQTMNDIKPFPFADIITPVYMDMFYISNYGQRTLAVFGEENSVEDIANIFVQMFYNKWAKLYEMAVANIDIDYNYTETQVEKVDDTGGNKSEITSTMTDLVNAYNDDDFVNDKQNENKSQNQSENTNQRNRDFTKKILQGGKTENFQKIISYLQNNFFNDIIVVDVNQFLTLSIFD